jgi:hypothetical protein
MKNTLAVVALASVISAACRAASPAPPVPDTLLACRRLPDEGERVRCYDAQIDKLNAAAAAGPAVTRAAPTAPKAAGSAATPNSPAPPAAPAVAAKQVDSTAKFGRETLPATARPKPSPQDEAALLSSITALRQVARATYAISLANGQVWRQEEASELSVFFRVGDSVRIEKGSLGSYRLSTDKTGAKNWVRVSRIQEKKRRA